VGWTLPNRCDNDCEQENESMLQNLLFGSRFPSPHQLGRTRAAEPETKPYLTASTTPESPV